MGPLAYGEVDQQQKGREDTLQETNGLEFCLTLISTGTEQEYLLHSLSKRPPASSPKTSQGLARGKPNRRSPYYWIEPKQDFLESSPFHRALLNGTGPSSRAPFW